MSKCEECYSENNRITPLLGAQECLENHEQYICSTCGRCICIGKDEKRGLRRWNFPFRSLEIAIIYLRTADVCEKTNCGIYEIADKKGRISYKIFPDDDNLKLYLSKNKNKICESMKSVYKSSIYREFPNTQIRMLTQDEVKKYLTDRKQCKF